MKKQEQLVWKMDEATHEESERNWRAENNRKAKARGDAIEAEALRKKQLARKFVNEMAEDMRVDACIRKALAIFVGGTVTACIGNAIGGVAWWFAVVVALGVTAVSVTMLLKEAKRCRG